MPKAASPAQPPPRGPHPSNPPAPLLQPAPRPEAYSGRPSRPQLPDPARRPRHPDPQPGPTHGGGGRGCRCPNQPHPAPGRSLPSSGRPCTQWRTPPNRTYVTAPQSVGRFWVAEVRPNCLVISCIRYPATSFVRQLHQLDYPTSRPIASDIANPTLGFQKSQCIGGWPCLWLLRWPSRHRRSRY